MAFSASSGVVYSTYAKPRPKCVCTRSYVNSTFFIVPYVENISNTCSLLTVRVKRPICIFVGRGVGDRFRRFRRSGDRDRAFGFSETGAGLRLSASFVSFCSFSFSFSFSFFTSFSFWVLLLLVRDLFRFGLVRSLLVLDEDDEELLDRELESEDDELEECDDESLDELLSDELRLLSLLLDPESVFFFRSLPLSFFLSFSESDGTRNFAIINGMASLDRKSVV